MKGFEGEGEGEGEMDGWMDGGEYGGGGKCGESVGNL